MQLTDTECRKAQPKDKQYRLSDLHGLSLIITTKGQNIGMYASLSMVNVSLNRLAHIQI